MITFGLVMFPTLGVPRFTSCSRRRARVLRRNHLGVFGLSGVLKFVGLSVFIRVSVWPLTCGDRLATCIGGLPCCLMSLRLYLRLVGRYVRFRVSSCKIRCLRRNGLAERPVSLLCTCRSQAYMPDECIDAGSDLFVDS